MTETRLRGMTWSDPRGYDPVVAAAAAWARIEPGVSIDWDKRSLQGFESTPVEELAATYDLMVIDHPHVGAVVREGCLLPLDRAEDETTLLQLESDSLGRSFASYRLAGRQWALPIDAACQVQAIRPDRLAAPLRHWAEVVAAGREGRAILPLRPPHALMSFFTLAANMGTPCRVTPGPLIPRAAGLRVLEALAALADHLDPASFGMDPIAVQDALAASDRLDVAPLTYLYAPYARQGYRSNQIAFHDIPALGAHGPIGSTLGGTGIAISARTAHPEACRRFALWLASAEVQSGLYAQNNGQPGNARAWGKTSVDTTVGGAYSNTRLTHEAAWVRPRHAGYMAFQEMGSQIISEALQGRISHDTALDALDLRFNESFAE